MRAFEVISGTGICVWKDDGWELRKDIWYFVKEFKGGARGAGAHKDTQPMRFKRRKYGHDDMRL